MASFKVLISDHLHSKGLELLESAEEIEVTNSPGLSKEELIEAIPAYNGLVIRSATKVTAEVIAAAKNLKVIARAGIGLDNVDIPEATKRGIIVMNAPDGNVVSTAEHTVAMLFAVSRNIPQANSSMKQGRWEKKKFQGKEIYNKTLGIIGLGRIGKVVAERARGLGMNVLAFDPYLSPDQMESLGVTYSPLNSLFMESDYITVHTPLTKETRSIINRRAIKRMKDGVFILNCARGGIVNEDDLYEGLKEGKVAAAAIDVFENEPPEDHPLLTLDNVIATPHLGASTHEAQEAVATDVVRQIIDYMKTGTIRNAVNVPSLDGEELMLLSPHLNLGEKLGMLATQITRGGLKKVVIEYVGEVGRLNTAPVTVSILKGLLTPMLEDGVNFVNAPHIAKERGIDVRTAFKEEGAYYNNAIILTTTTASDQSRLVGTIFGKRQPRLVRINAFYVEAAMEGHVLLVYNMDTPGVIGSIGELLGKHGINIATMDVGRVLDSGQNIILLETDTPVPTDVKRGLLDFPHVNQVVALEL